MSKVDYDNIGVENDGDIIFITVSKYKLFMSYGKIGIDAMTLYMHLMFTARLQATNKVWANNTYVRQGLKWSKERLLKAKSLLFDLDLISQEQIKDETGRFGKFYITVRTRTTSLELGYNITGGLKSGQRLTRLPENDRKCLNEKDKCLNEKEITSEMREVYIIWIRSNLTKHSSKVLSNKIKTKHYKQIKDYGKDEVIKAVKNYTMVLQQDKYYWNHKYTFWDFISRGVEKFLDESDPLSNYLKTDSQLKLVNNNDDALSEYEDLTKYKTKSV